jgi:hypothetical protein
MDAPKGVAIVVLGHLPDGERRRGQLDREENQGKLGIGAVVTADLTHDEVLPAPVDF